jgi:hypothetical protein
MMGPKSWRTSVHDELKGVRAPAIPPAFVLFLSCFSPAISAQIAACVVNPARDAGTRRENREISTNELLKPEITERRQSLARRPSEVVQERAR